MEVMALPINSKKKGKGGELEWSRVCRAEGYDVRRTSQYCGQTGDASDCIGLPGIHQEIKRVEKLNVHDAVAQAVRDSTGKNELPIVAHRRNNTQWLVTMRAEDWFRLYREWGGIDDRD